MTQQQPNKPDGEIENEKEKPAPIDDRAAAENQSSVTPDDYPGDADGKPDYGGN